MPKIIYDATLAHAELQRLIAAGTNPRPLLLAVGETLLASTRARFASGTAPDGTRWAANKDSTVQGLLFKYKGSFGKPGLTKKGAQRAAGKKPLIGESLQLSTKINYRVTGNAVEIGSPMIYGGVHQFGARKGAFGSTKRGAPIPLGDIPARPFLGLSAQDRTGIDNLAARFILPR